MIIAAGPSFCLLLLGNPCTLFICCIQTEARHHRDRKEDRMNTL